MTQKNTIKLLIGTKCFICRVVDFFTISESSFQSIISSLFIVSTSLNGLWENNQGKLEFNIMKLKPKIIF